MRYWAYLAGKLAAAGAVFYGLLVMIDHLIPKGRAYTVAAGEKDFKKLMAPLDSIGNSLAINVALMVWFILVGVALYFIIQDQRYRCRVCLRRLRMPVETGSWGRMLQLGRPKVEWICTYGHGTLQADEVQISGLTPPEWKAQSGDIWEELCDSIIKEDKK
jgi:hypothetical protein